MRGLHRNPGTVLHMKTDKGLHRRHLKGLNREPAKSFYISLSWVLIKDYKNQDGHSIVCFKNLRQ